ncbi:MAG TPA: potassium transporter Kup [Myxococcota bacterium]|nr:potassium transporter Kup [Myxococcota bacterium]
MESPRSPTHSDRYVLALTLGALGVVFGDIGTSPLYALRECFHGAYGVEPTRDNVLGVLSLVLWSLILLIAVKYQLFVMRADNRGEGGMLALVALTSPRSAKTGWRLALIGIFGTSLLYGDGMITPAISVLSAVEGLGVETPALGRFVVPATLGILIALFSIQRHGTGRVGALFGPIVLAWFVALFALGIYGITLDPTVLGAVDPRHALAFFEAHGWHAFVVLAAVFLVVTGGEALYADMGHFGLRPIRLAWFAVVMPSLVVHYFGQGGLLLSDAAAAEHPFYHLAPGWAHYPLVALATAAAVIASQAMISGAFSLTHQAIQLGFCPRLAVNHTSAQESGQIYVGPVNWMLMVSSCALVVGFGSSAAMAAAYGTAVAASMVLTTVLLTAVARQRWGWTFGALAFGAVFLPIDLAFLGSNLLKLLHGGWITLVVAGFIFTLMSTWKRGRRVLQSRLEETALPVDLFLPDLETSNLPRASHAAVFLTGDPQGTPHALLHNIKHNQVVHEQTIFLTARTEEVPWVPAAERMTVKSLGRGFYRIVAHYGFMEIPDVPALLGRVCADHGLAIDLQRTSYFLGRENLIPSGTSGMARWREMLFALMSQNAQSATTYFRLPPNQVVELGAQVEL